MFSNILFTEWKSVLFLWDPLRNKSLRTKRHYPLLMFRFIPESVIVILTNVMRNKGTISIFRFPQRLLNRVPAFFGICAMLLEFIVARFTILALHSLFVSGYSLSIISEIFLFASIHPYKDKVFLFCLV